MDGETLKALRKAVRSGDPVKLRLLPDAAYCQITDLDERDRAVTVQYQDGNGDPGVEAILPFALIHRVS